MIVVVFVLITMIFVTNAVVCVENGACEVCKGDEVNESYCTETGNRIELTCGSEKIYQSCDLSSSDEQTNLFLFQIVMGVVGGLAYWGVQVRKLKNMSLFDMRKRSARMNGLAT